MKMSHVVVTMEDLDGLHEELARHCMREGRIHGDKKLIRLGKKLLKAVEEEGESAVIVDEIRKYIYS